LRPWEQVLLSNYANEEPEGQQHALLSDFERAGCEAIKSNDQLAMTALSRKAIEDSNVIEQRHPLLTELVSRLEKEAYAKTVDLALSTLGGSWSSEPLKSWLSVNQAPFSLATSTELVEGLHNHFGFNESPRIHAWLHKLHPDVLDFVAELNHELGGEGTLTALGGVLRAGRGIETYEE